jgi:molecular chaperone DnaK
MLRDQASTVSDEDKATLETPLASLKTALSGNDNSAIKEATSNLTTALQAFGQKLYEAAARDTNAAGSSASGQSTSSNDEEIVDAEIVDDK